MEPEVIDAQYRGRHTGWKIALIGISHQCSDLAFSTSHEDGTSTSREACQAYKTSELAKT